MLCVSIAYGKCISARAGLANYMLTFCSILQSPGASCARLVTFRLLVFFVSSVQPFLLCLVISLGERRFGKAASRASGRIGRGRLEISSGTTALILSRTRYCRIYFPHQLFLFALFILGVIWIWVIKL